MMVSALSCAGPVRRSRSWLAAPRFVLALLCFAAIGLACCAVGSAASTPSGYRVQRLCGHPRAGGAACMAMKLIDASLTPAQLQASALRQESESAAGASPAVAVKSPEPGFLTPRKLHTAYALATETPAGSTQTIAVVDAFDDPTAEVDLGVYDEQFGLPPCTSANGCFAKINQRGRAKPLPRKEGEWAGEISIDVQMAHAICQNCHVLLVEANSESFHSLGKAVDAAVAAGASEISNSYGAPEKPGRDERLAQLSASDFNHPGLVIAASAGDCGYINQACRGLAKGAEFPADAPSVVAVGGTTLRSAKKVWTSSAWEEGGSGCSALFSAPLWQSAVPDFSATACAGGRSVADVAAIGDPDTGVDVFDSTPEGNGDPTGWGVWGGTSVSSPIIAAEFALAGGAQGVEYPASTLYSHLGQASALYDVVSGVNGSCGEAISCRAAVGYDGPTGVGSPIGLTAFSVG